MNERGEITLSIPGELRFVWTVGVATKAVCVQGGMPRAEAGLVELAVVEAVNNSIIHAYGGNGQGTVDVQISLMGQCIKIDICDEGEKRLILSEPELDFDPDDVQNLPEGQMGWFIINQVMDQVSYSHHQGKNHLSMSKFMNTSE